MASACCRPSPVSVVRPAVAPIMKPRVIWSPAAQMASPVRWNPNIRVEDVDRDERVACVEYEVPTAVNAARAPASLMPTWMIWPCGLSL